MYVNVIIPVYGKPEVLNLTLQALARQHFTDFSVYLIDQGGTIPIETVRNAFENRLDIHYIDAPANTTVSEKRNMAIRESSGDVVIFLDADTIVCTDYVNEHVAMQRAGHEVVIGYIYGKKGIQREELLYTGEWALDPFLAWFDQEYGHIPDEREKYYKPVQDHLMQLSWPWAVFWSGNISVSRVALQQAGGFDRRFTGWGIEDIEVGYRLVQSGYALTLSRAAWAVHVPHEVNEAKRMREQTANARIFLRKYPLIENELFLAKAEAWKKDSASIGSEIILDDATCGTIIDAVTSSYGTHFLLVGYDERLYSLSQVSTMLDPRGEDAAKFEISGKSVYNLAGFCMPFESDSFDGCIITPVWTWYRPELLTRLLTEALRTSRVCYCICPGNEAIPLLAAIAILKKMGSHIEYSIVNVIDRNMKLVTCVDHGFGQ
ncbi:glycosyltransferase family 2 protein [Paenibacillus pabuli]|uniref:glycosyltransferase family 2 protein n=1 Tax=Paenibacillus pabuli TaxID=1472 RepID=UPI003CFB99C2